MNARNISSLIIGFIVIISFACKKALEIAPPRNQLVSEIIFSDSSDASAAVLGLYAQIMKGQAGLTFGNGGITVYTGFSGDEIYPTGNERSEMQLFQNSVSPIDNDLMHWSFAYNLIYHANACIEGTIESKNISQILKLKLIAEAKFIRALYYFNLVNLFGDVPFITSPDYQSNSIMTRTPVATIYEQLIIDLKESKGNLSSEYSSGERIRANRYAASALLARIYLYRKEWEKAEEEASFVISSSYFSLMSSVAEVFEPNSLESILQFIPLQPGLHTAEGYKFNPGDPTVYPACVVTDFLLSAFEAGDIRKTEWLNYSEIGGIYYYYPFKYKLGYDGSPTPLEYYTVLRLAEQYLIRAEARCELNKLTESLEDLNAIRLRAGLAAVSANDIPTILSYILHERQVELFCEWGHRWFDLKRTGSIDAVLGVEKPNWESTDQLFPIPYREIQSNPFLTQNPGY